MSRSLLASVMTPRSLSASVIMSRSLSVIVIMSRSLSVLCCWYSPHVISFSSIDLEARQGLEEKQRLRLVSISEFRTYVFSGLYT
ncbi:hypothetical protein H5410_013467 [Solanum commersonii]|uniref:Uncharacterized protein n=1 Tax=Solanum commersonii TaxID=4109 RepID=A0A9J6AV66_SOLCO|nr:hypothetical protein H5410_013467 [Solanum commersonii]